MTEIIEKELTAEEIAERKAYDASSYDRQVEEVKLLRHAAYTSADGSDSLYMKYQRQEDGVTKQAWLDRVAEINAEYPYPEK